MFLVYGLLASGLGFALGQGRTQQSKPTDSSEAPGAQEIEECPPCELGGDGSDAQASLNHKVILLERQLYQCLGKTPLPETEDGDGAQAMPHIEAEGQPEPMARLNREAASKLGPEDFSQEVLRAEIPKRMEDAGLSAVEIVLAECDDQGCLFVGVFAFEGEDMMTAWAPFRASMYDAGRAFTSAQRRLCAGQGMFAIMSVLGRVPLDTFRARAEVLMDDVQTEQSKERCDF